ncbi:ferruginol synthase-like [Olea europaea var. sylvestris]|uniref:Ferruginol synthase-like n=1 Tax=Olea europaea subsp. europaea TaxID=158383 RepID=A0A8S0UX57_OLEEU|nr:ferruginol synthase-like [Olea europaea var. sylvestris]CAA3025243.1 ferruginol synthase-like [Olea europaea subsp. europaea]
MEFLTIFLVVLSFLVWHVLRSNLRRWRTGRLPPGPHPFPIIGNILQLGENPHQSLTKLSKIYGPLMYLKLGSRDSIVISSPDIAKQVLQEHDQVFSSRTIPAAAAAYDHFKKSMAWLPVSSQWRKLRKLCKEQMFSLHRLDASKGLRQEKMKKLCNYVHDCCISDQVVDISEAAFITSLNLISATLFSTDFAQFNSDSSQEMKNIVRVLLANGGLPNLADFFPVLEFIDPQGIRRKTKSYMSRIFVILDDLINQRLKSRSESLDHPVRNDLLEAILNHSQASESELTLDVLKHLLLDLFIAGTDTTSSTVEWIMTELIRNPEKMSKARNELWTVIGRNKQVEESDISRLPYLQSVIKETFRYHPPAPFLVPHKAEVDTEINGYTIPKDAQILVNVWATGRDSSLWLNPDSFEPERFLNREVDFKGQDFELIPFGSGRRMCPGLPLADRMVHLMVAALIHNFDWKLEKGMKPEEVDVSEKFGLSIQKAVPLKAFPIKL